MTKKNTEIKKRMLEITQRIKIIEPMIKELRKEKGELSKEYQQLEVQFNLTQEKNKVPTLEGESIMAYYSEKMNQASLEWKCDHDEKEKRFISSLIDGKNLTKKIDNKSIFEWLEGTKNIQITIEKKQDKFICFVKIREGEIIRYYKSHPDNSGHKDKNDNYIYEFVCWEVFAENNFEFIKSPQSFISELLYNQGSISTCRKCGKKEVMLACGQTPLAVYRIPPRELCSCFSSPDLRDLITQELLIKQECIACWEMFTKHDFSENNYLPFVRKKDVRWKNNDNPDSEAGKIFRFFNSEPSELTAEIKLEFFHELCPKWEEKEMKNI